MIIEKNNDFVLRKITGTAFLIPTGDASLNLNGMVTLNELASFLWENLDSCSSSTQLAKLVSENYQVSEAEAKKDIEDFLKTMEKSGMVKITEDNESYT